MQLYSFANLFQPGKYPWLVTVLSTSSPVDLVCAGTLVASKYVVTAAHCMFLDQDATQPVSAADVTVGEWLDTLRESDIVC